MRAVLIGVGESGSQVGRYAHGKGIRLVGAVSRTTGVGQDLGDHLHLDEPLGVTISDDAATVLESTQPDVVLIATTSTVEPQEEVIGLSLRAGADVLSLAEHGFFPTAGTAEVLGRLDAVAIEHGRSVFFGGVQDVFWYHGLLSLTGAAQDLQWITGETTSDLADLGEAVVASCPLGLDAGEFRRATARDDEHGELYAMEPALLAVLARLGLDVEHRSTTVEPVMATRDLDCAVLGTTLRAGTSRGFAEVVDIVAGGVRVQGRFLSVIMEDGESAEVTWRVGGEPELRSSFPLFPGYEVTASNLVNRIPAVIAAAPGHRTPLDLPAPIHWAGPRAEGSPG
jgi:hypothetical protein